MARVKTDPPRGILRAPANYGQRHLYARYHPSSDLDEYVEHYWRVEWDRRGLEPARAETLPHPSVHVTFERGVGGRVRGVMQGRFSRLLRGQGSVFAVKFRPAGFYPFAGVPLTAFTDRVVGLREVWGRAARSFERAMLAEADDAARVEIVEEFLRHRRPAPDSSVTCVSQIVYSVAADRTILKVEDLVNRCDVGVRTLQRLFAKCVGVSPKWVIQRYRLHEAAARLAGSPAVSQAGLASELGYSDQAHFVRDFKRIVGTSPAAYARAAREASPQSRGGEAIRQTVDVRSARRTSTTAKPAS